MSLKVSHLYKSYDKPIIQDFSYTFEDNHIYAITGPSGCGKTTLLYLLGFLEKKDQGSILIDDKEPKSIQKLYKHTILNCKMKLELRNWDKGACPFIPIRVAAGPYSQFL